MIQTVDALAASTLGSREQDVIRQAADSLSFSHDLLGDDAAREALRRRSSSTLPNGLEL